MNRAAQQFPIVGREQELALVDDAITRCRAGTGTPIVIEGEAGIGKSRLALEAARRAADSGFEVFVGRALRLERLRPFAALVHALELAGDAPSDRKELGRLVTSHDSRQAEGTAQLDYKATDAIVTWIESRTERLPVFLAVEDLHWADPATLLTTQRLARRAPEMRLVLLVTTRQGQDALDLNTALADMHALGATFITPGPLDRGDVVKIAETFLEASPGPRLLELLEKTAGNPLFATELLLSLQHESAIDRRQTVAEIGVGYKHLPDSLKSSVLRRLAPLSDLALDILRICAVLGPVFDLNDLFTVVPRPVNDLHNALDEAIRSALLIDDGDELRFRHELVRDAIYFDMSTPTRKQLHKEIARSLMQAGADPADVAIHFSLGAVRGDAEAVERIRLAATESTSRSPQVAIQLLQRAVEVAGDGYPDRIGMQIQLFDLLLAVGKAVEAEKLLDALAPDVTLDVQRAARARQARAHLIRGRYADSVRQYELARAGTPADRDIRLGAAEALARVYALDVEGAQRVLAEIEDPVVRWPAERLAYDYLGYFRRSSELADPIDDRLRRAPNTEDVLTYFVDRATDMLYRDRFSEQLELVQLGSALAERHGVLWRLPQFYLNRGEVAFLSGEWDDASAEFEAGIELARDIDTRWASFQLYGWNALIQVRRGNLTGARSVLDAAAEAVMEADRGVAWIQPVNALLVAAQGAPQEGLDQLAARWDSFIEQDLLGFIDELACPLMELALAAGDTERARKTMKDVESLSERAQIDFVTATRHRCEALLTRNPEPALAAVDIYKASPRRVQLYDACELAGTLLSGGAYEHGLALLEEAASGYDDIGAARDAARVDALLRRLGRRRPRGRGKSGPAMGWDALSKTEERIAHMIAEGLSNPEIAERLYISRHTVATHVKHIFIKLEVTSRSQLAARAAINANT